MSQEPTMVTHDPSWQFRIGKVDKLSFKDVQIVNIMYKCDGKYTFRQSTARLICILLCCA